jgi:NAD(P)-dependent dehydrogenase (short-subunit alcohol dehydrogenase family)
LDYIPLKLDLSIQQSVRIAAAEVLSWSGVPTIDIVVNSAGVMNIQERTLSQEGIEMHFATNHIGHFLFSCLIMPKLLKSADDNPKGAMRLINVSSASPQMACMRWSDLNLEKRNKDLPEAEQPPYGMHRVWGTTDPENKTYLPLEGYNQSKVANVLFSIAANKRLYEKHGILISLTVHPGVIRTELSRHNSPETRKAIEGLIDKGVVHLKTTSAGAATSLVAALDAHLGVGETKDGKENYGVHLVDCQISDKASSMAVSSDEAEKLWMLSVDLVNEKFTW